MATATQKEIELTGRRIVFDFDGVIHRYISPWTTAGEIRDEPVEGIKEVIDTLKDNGFSIAVVSARCNTKTGQRAVERWLRDNDIQVDLVTNVKVGAILYIDDRAMCFKGQDAKTLLSEIRKFTPWGGVYPKAATTKKKA